MNITTQQTSAQANTPTNALSKEQQYQEVLSICQALVADETNSTANMANITAILKETFGWLWVGFYIVDTQDNQLVLGPFQGPLACTRINYGKGVCGEVWQQAQTQLVDDVHAHPNHIACSSRSNSEIVVPLFKDDSVVAVLDIDSEEFATFDATDKEYLERIAALL